MKFINKITVSEVCGNVKIIVKEMKNGAKKEILRVIGIANDIQTGESDFGLWTALKGEFKAINLLTKEEYISGKCCLPKGVVDLVAGQFGGEVKKVQFAFDIIVVEDIDSQVGYHYEAEPLLKPQENNPLHMLEHQIKK